MHLSFVSKATCHATASWNAPVWRLTSYEQCNIVDSIEFDGNSVDMSYTGAQNALLSYSDEYSFSRSSCHYYYFERCNLKSNNIHLAWRGSGLDRMAWKWPVSHYLWCESQRVIWLIRMKFVSGHVCVWCVIVCAATWIVSLTPHTHTIHTLLEWMATFGHLQCAYWALLTTWTVCCNAFSACRSANHIPLIQAAKHCCSGRKHRHWFYDLDICSIMWTHQWWIWCHLPVPMSRLDPAVLIYCA